MSDLAAAAQPLREPVLEVGRSSARLAVTPTLVVADYPIGHASGFGETLVNLFCGVPRDRLWSAHPAHLEASAGKRHHQSLPFPSPQRPAWWPALAAPLYYPILKTRQSRAIRATADLLHRVIDERGIQNLLLIPVTPWILAAGLELHRRHPKLHLGLFVMDDWQGHHEAYGIPYTSWRRELLATVIARAHVRFAVSREMAAHYEASTGASWRVAHNGVARGQWSRAVRRNDKPSRVLLTGDVNVFRFDAVLAFAHALARYNQQQRANLEFTILGDVAAEYRKPLLDLQGVRLAGRRPQAECQRAVEQSDLLYLPLAFAPRCARIVRYSMPTKLPEYLASGKPILFHAPPDAAVHGVAKRHGLAPCLTTLDGTALDDFISAWAQNRIASQPAAAGATALAEEFDLAILATDFQAALCRPGNS